VAGEAVLDQTFDDDVEVKIDENRVILGMKYDCEEAYCYTYAMNEEHESRNTDQLMPNQHEEAVALARGGLEQHEQFNSAHPGDDSRINGTSYSRKDRDDGSVEEETLEVASSDVGYLKITHNQHWGDHLLVPRYIDSYTMVADYASSRGHIVITDGKVQSADYVDYDDQSNTVRGDPTRGFEMAAYTIGETEKELLATPK